MKRSKTGGGAVSSLTEQDLLRWRLSSQLLTTDGAAAAGGDPAAVVEHLLCVQAENHQQAAWALSTRCGADAQRILDCHDSGEVLRTHVLRTTWHYVRPTEIGWLLDLCQPRLTPIWTRQLDAVGVDEAARAEAVSLVERTLAAAGSDDGPRHLARSEIAAALAAAGMALTGMPLGHLLGYAETLGVICSGVRRRDHTYALLDERAPRRRKLSPEEARTEIARRYAAGHGPVTERDLAYWATMTLGDARAGLADAGLESVEVAGSTYWFTGEPLLRDPTPRAHLLQILDELYRGYQDSRGLIDRAGLRPAGRETSIGMTVVDGQMVGSMSRTLAGDTVTFVIGLWRKLDDDQEAAVTEAAARYAAFLDRVPVLKLAVVALP